MIPPFTLYFLLLIPCSPSLISPPFYPFCRYLPLCHSFRPLWQSCLANSFPSTISSFATSSAALGSYAYPIRSHIVLVLMSSSPPLCHIALLLPLFLEHSILPLITDDPVTFYDIPWYSGSCALPSSTFYAFPLLSDASWYLLPCSIPFSLDLLTGSVYPCDPIVYFPLYCRD